MSPNSSYVEMILMTRMNQHPPVHHPFEYYYDSELTTMIQLTSVLGPNEKVFSVHQPSIPRGSVCRGLATIATQKLWWVFCGGKIANWLENKPSLLPRQNFYVVLWHSFVSIATSTSALACAFSYQLKYTQPTTPN